MEEAQISIRTTDGEGVVRGRDFDDIVDVVRQIPGRRWDPAARAWRLPCTLAEARKQLEAAGLRVEGSATVIIQEDPATALSAPPVARPRDQVTIRATDGEAGVVGGAFWDMVGVVKSIEGRRWQPREKVWQLPCTLDEARAAVEAMGLALRLPGEQDESELPATRVEPASPEGARRDQVRIHAADGPGVVTGGAFRAMLDAVKTIEGRRWNRGAKQWDLPCTLDEAARVLEQAGFSVELLDGQRPSPAEGGE